MDETGSCTNNASQRSRCDDACSNAVCTPCASVDKIPEDVVRTLELTKRMDVGDEFVSFDFAKTHMTSAEFSQIVREMDEKDLVGTTAKMFGGEKINFTEDRSVLHTLLRDEDIINSLARESPEASFGGEKETVKNELWKIKRFCEELHNGTVKGVTGKGITTIVNIGIGGSDLGPRMVCEALECYALPGMRSFFVSNVDPSEMKSVLAKVNAEETLFVVVSKTFTTQETIANARMALEVVARETKTDIADVSNKHFVAVSSNLDEVTKFGIENIFAMWDFVGGRYSLWSAAGLSIALYIGFDHFLRLLSGASAIDRHFRSDPLRSIQTLHAAIEIYYGNVGYSTKCIVPYDFYMRSFYLHIQQLDMESNGKTATREGRASKQTGMIVWGGVGTNSQHSFFQLLHQGTHKVLTELLVPLTPDEDFETSGTSHHAMVLANCFAQGEALMKGSPADDTNRAFDGDRPSITICYSRLTPEVLGALVAHYEHKVFVQGLYWGINSFDQFGVQLGKTIAGAILKSIESVEDSGEYSPSTLSAIEMARAAQNKPE